MGLLFLPPLALLSHYFRRNRVFATGIVISGSSCGGIIFPIMLNQLINKNGASFGWSVRAISFVMLGCLIVATLLMKTRLPNRRQREKMGIMKEKHDLKGIVTDRAFLMTAIGCDLLRRNMRLDAQVPLIGVFLSVGAYSSLVRFRLSDV
jgi:MFS family permease